MPAAAKAVLAGASLVWPVSCSVAMEADGGGGSALVRSVALAELREDDVTREQALRALREWIAANRDVEDVRTDAKFLLRFLRVKKFSLPMAQQVLLKYLNFKKTFSYLIPNLDPLDSRINEMITKGFVFVLPRRDRNGRRVVFYIPSKVDPQKDTKTDIGRAIMMTYEALMEDEDSQVLGVTHIGDFRRSPPGLVTLFGPNEFARIVKWGEQSVPMRHKQVHALNVPAPLRYVYDFARSRMSEKMRNRFIMHESMDALHSMIGSEILPKEYGGEMPMEEMIGLWKKELLVKRERLISLDVMKIISDKGIITRTNTQNGIYSNATGIEFLNGSFRKLEVD